MLDFLRGNTDVLVCTTIVEAGLDISSANTLIVERADALGLAHLYHIRGRPGLSRAARGLPDLPGGRRPGAGPPPDHRAELRGVVPRAAAPRGARVLVRS